MVPPKPEEPDNCCMSGCVNCVWDAYGDEVEAWSSAKREAREAISKLSGDEKSEAEGKLGIKPTTAAAPAVNAAAGAVDASMSMDDDGGGSQMVDLPDDPLKDVPVGIREFMKQEKKLKERKINAEEGR